MKKFLGVFLSFSMLITVMPPVAWANEMLPAEEISVETDAMAETFDVAEDAEDAKVELKNPYVKQGGEAEKQEESQVKAAAEMIQVSAYHAYSEAGYDGPGGPSYTYLGDIYLCLNGTDWIPAQYEQYSEVSSDQEIQIKIVPKSGYKYMNVFLSGDYTCSKEFVRPGGGGEFTSGSVYDYNLDSSTGEKIITVNLAELEKHSNATGNKVGFGVAFLPEDTWFIQPSGITGYDFASAVLRGNDGAEKNLLAAGAMGWATKPNTQYTIDYTLQEGCILKKLLFINLTTGEEQDITETKTFTTPAQGNVQIKAIAKQKVSSLDPVLVSTDGGQDWESFSNLAEAFAELKSDGTHLTNIVQLRRNVGITESLVPAASFTLQSDVDGTRRSIFRSNREREFDLLAPAVTKGNIVLKDIELDGNSLNGTTNLGRGICIANPQQSVIMENCAVRNNTFVENVTSEASAEGSGIYIKEANTVTLTGCEILNNVSRSLGRGYGYGGGLKVGRTINFNMEDCVVSGNRFYAEGTYGYGYGGGAAVYTADKEIPATITNSQFTNNLVLGSTSATAAAFYINGENKVVLDRVTVENNTAEGGSLVRQGSIIYLINGDLHIKDSSITNNLAKANQSWGTTLENVNMIDIFNKSMFGIDIPDTKNIYLSGKVVIEGNETENTRTHAVAVANLVPPFVVEGNLTSDSIIHVAKAKGNAKFATLVQAGIIVPEGVFVADDDPDLEAEIRNSTDLYWNKEEVVDPMSAVVDKTAGTAQISGVKNGDGTYTYTVKCDDACVVAYSDNNGGSYNRVNAVNNGDGTYSFNVEDLPANRKVFVAKKGDLNSDGKVTVMEGFQAKRVANKLHTFTAFELLVADLNGNGEVSVFEGFTIQRQANKLGTISW